MFQCCFLSNSTVCSEKKLFEVYRYDGSNIFMKVYAEKYHIILLALFMLLV